MIDISELSRLSGFSASKLRYYEEVGLIRSVGRRGLKRLYENEVKARISLIALAQTAGFSLLEIKEMIGTEGTPDLKRSALEAKADAIDVTIRELTSLRDGLRHVMNCTAPSHLECPRFQRIMHVALTRKRPGAAKRRNRPTNG
ncbi:helix-turn-helix domain-containing protein [Lentibacter sp. XHP0401]|uniref:helix-turn-helix domain-containing protein n=1 Tax=Lentibacter sp. XHP0401 TaxID=2984334 RepID=UPI0021E81A6E|nr:helix-turn-helix domain-containing protein [Lentibacter sp. XHP0401]MCV2893326.1 helix-turn-helix domain-containing protein [Lentibacter sp. XHP0401]